MRTFLLGWNPNRWKWSTWQKDLEQLKESGYLQERWSTGKRKDLPVGSRVFLIRLGVEPRGIIGYGQTNSLPQVDDHFDPDLASEGKKAIYVGVTWEHLSDIPVIPLNRLRRPPFDKNHWSIQGSGVELHTPIDLELYREWWLQKQDRFFDSPEEVDEREGYKEGAVRIVRVNYYERNPKAREQCVEHFGAQCVVCGMEFHKVYGEIAKDFIHVHHLKPLHMLGKDYVVDPVNDLRPVCPNCHAVLHKKKPPYTIEELKNVFDLREKRKG